MVGGRVKESIRSYHEETEAGTKRVMAIVAKLVKMK
jgi:hypothetical protein